MQHWINKFISHLEGRYLSPHTVSNYRRDLLNAAEFYQQQSITEWQEITPTHIRHLIITRHSKGLNGRSLQRQLSALRTFFSYLLKNGELNNNPTTGIKAPKSARKLPKTLNTEQTSQLLNKDPKDDLSIRDFAIMELLYSSGLRVAELTQLNLEDIDLTDATVRITGKGGKIRIIPVGRFARKAIQSWLKVRDTLVKQNETAIFVGRRGGRLTTRAVQLRLKEWGIKQQLDVPLHPHMLRHSFASHLLESSGQIRVVQELLGHADLSSTQIYTHLDFQHLASVYDKTHPRAKKKKTNS